MYLDGAPGTVQPSRDHEDSPLSWANLLRMGQLEDESIMACRRCYWAAGPVLSSESLLSIMIKCLKNFFLKWSVFSAIYIWKHLIRWTDLPCPAAWVQPRQNPGDTLRMNGVSERKRRHVRPALIGPSLRGRERERERASERARENDQTGVFAGSGRVWQCFIFYRGFYTLN